MKEKLKRLRVCLLAATLLSFLFLQNIMAGTTGKISGKVVDASTKEPLVGVNVIILETTTGAAGENGFKRFRGRIDDVRIGSSIDQIRFDITNIENDKEKVLSHGYRLFQNYPNPFNPATTIEYSTPEAGFITIKLYSILGKELATLVEGIKEPGNHKVIFDAGKLKSGIYFYRLQAGSYNETKKLILIK
jgi:hypothetical protein